MGRDDDAGQLIDLAQQMEEQRSAGGAERQVAQFVQDDEVGVGKPSRNLPGPPLKLFLFEGVDEFDGGEEPDALAVMFDGLNADRFDPDRRTPNVGATKSIAGAIQFISRARPRVPSTLFSRRRRRSPF